MEHGEAGAYMPIGALPYWSVIGPYARDVVARLRDGTRQDEDAIYAAVTPFLLWCWQTRALDLTDERVLRARNVNAFIASGMPHHLWSSRATIRSALWRILEQLAPAEAVESRRSIGRRDPTQPYSSTEVAALYSWADTQTTGHRRDDALALLALGLGAGLSTRELLSVTGEHCRVRDDVTWIKVTGARSRDVLVGREWGRTLASVVEHRRDTLLFRPGRASVADGQVTDFVTRSRTSLDVRPSRMRTTWLLGHLRDQTPPAKLLEFSGLTSLAALDRIAVFLPSEANR